MNRSVLALRHLAFEDLGLLEPLLRERGFTDIEVRDAGVDRLDDPASADAFDLVVVLGGPIGAEDDTRYPFLVDEVRLIERRLTHARPLLGICLGAQLMARALGARVEPMPHGRKEIGFAPLSLTDPGLDSPLAARQADLPVLHWHGDQFALPAGLPSLAETPSCPNQAFMVGTTALALQFHLEADPRRIEQWLVGHAGELQQTCTDLAALREAAVHHGPRLAPAPGELLDRWCGLWPTSR